MPYAIDTAKQEALSAAKPFLTNPKYFKNVRISPSAAMKMMMHVQSGVEKGIKNSITGKPTEVMGYLIGRQCTEDPTCFIIGDAQALPIEGFETSVIAATDEVMNYQINWLELNGKSRHPCEKFCGWYHSHPFDLEDYSHCFLSNTDVTTQLAWQRSCEKDGDPWLAIVIDPLRSLARNALELQSFRVYPPEYTSSLNETPDGKIVSDDKLRLTLWGSCWNRYYRLNTSFYMSQLSSDVLGILKNNFLWQDSFSSTVALEPEQKQTTADRLKKIAMELAAVDINSGSSGLSKMHKFRGLGSSAAVDRGGMLESIEGRAAALSGGSGGGSGALENDSTPSLTRTIQAGCSLAAEQCHHCCSQMAKLALFGNPNMRAASSTGALQGTPRSTKK